jgi:Cu-Zn family superoxide dismutase
VRATIVVALAVLATGACARPAHRAVATFQPLGGSGVAGSATFVERDGTTTVRIEARNVSPGAHGVHVHEVGDCSAPDGASAGDHFSPGGGAHGGHDDHAHHHHHGGSGGHAGDLGNLEADAQGRGVLEVESTTLTVQPGTYSVVGRAVIIHEQRDDLMTQPGGASGARIGCGIIRRAD